MKNILLVGVSALVAFVSVNTSAESISGKVISKEGDTVVVRQSDGTKMTLTATPDTTYREKKVAKHDKMRQGKKIAKGQSYYKPMVEEDDWVDIVYSPDTNSVYVIEDVVIYDD